MKNIIIFDMPGTLKLCIIFGVCSALFACSTPKQMMKVEPSSTPFLRIAIAQKIYHGRGIACKFNGSIGPVTYSINDIGKAGMPHLSFVERQKLKWALKIDHAKTVRFGTMNMSPTGFFVFDAQDGPCSSVGDIILDTTDCGISYFPLDNPYDYIANTGGCTPLPYKGP